MSDNSKIQILIWLLVSLLTCVGLGACSESSTESVSAPLPTAPPSAAPPSPSVESSPETKELSRPTLNYEVFNSKIGIRKFSVISGPEYDESARTITWVVDG